MLTYLRIGAAAAFLLLLGWALRLDALRADWRDQFLNLKGQADKVVAAVSLVTGNEKLVWKDTETQIKQFGEDHKALLAENEDRNHRIDELCHEHDRLMAQNRSMVAEIAELKRKRQGLIEQLESEGMTPRDETDCWAQIRAADEALNKLYREGF